MFMMNTVADRAGTLIKEQNIAALKLSNDLRYFEDHHLLSDMSVPPGLLTELVEFSRNTVTIKNEVDRMRRFGLVRGRPQDGSEGSLSSYHVAPGINADEIWTVGNQQLASYQSVRDSSQEACTSYKDLGGAVSTYLLPLLYALLGAFLCDLKCRMALKGSRATPLGSARYTTAIIAGAMIGTFTSVIPISLSLPTLLVAFLLGYSVDIFTAKLDSLTDKLRAPVGET
jgi:hypothetical protein